MLLGFKKRFVEPIQIGSKVHTMRKKRKVKPKIGETLYMYTGLRTSNCCKISDREKLMGIQKVFIKGSLNRGLAGITIWVDERILSNEEVNILVRFDGFTDQNDFVTFWLDGKKSGRFSEHLELFHWTDLKY